jgi:DNA-binding NarL/FixJ family response regulator
VKPYSVAVPIRVVLAEDNYLVREGVRQLIDAQPELQVVAVCTDFESLLGAVEEHKPDVVLTDIRKPPTGTDEGIRAAGGIAPTDRRGHP